MFGLVAIVVAVAIVAFVADWFELRGHAERNPMPLAVSITKSIRNGTVYTVTDRGTPRAPADRSPMSGAR